METDALPVRDSIIQPGETAPNFTLKDQAISDWTLADHLGKGEDLVLAFYPMDFSPVCDTENKCATAEMAQFQAKGARVVGISCDSFFTHKAYAEQLGLTHTLLADMHRAVCRAYGLYFPDLNVAARGTVVVGSDGVVKWSQTRDLSKEFDLPDLLDALA
ncbi:MAG: redoxin domain-containing protein [Planctomycetota bacterium]